MTRFLRYGVLLLALRAAAALVSSGTSFTPTVTRLILSPPVSHHSTTTTTQSLTITNINRRRTSFLHLSSSPSPQEDETTTSTSTTAQQPTDVAETKKNDYPIDAPSPLLLSSSMILAITSVGSVFEIIGGSPMMGFIPSVLFALIGLPSCLFLFYAAIKKGAAETEADDAEYRKDYY